MKSLGGLEDLGVEGSYMLWLYEKSCNPKNAGPPRPVGNLQVIAPTATTLTITWTMSGFADRFEVTYNYITNRCYKTGGPITHSIPDSSTRSHTLTNLNEDSSYNITVRAINAGGSAMTTILGNTLNSGKH